MSWFGLKWTEADSEFWTKLGEEQGKRAFAQLPNEPGIKEAFYLWIRAKDKRLWGWLRDPEDAARAFLATRYEDWK